MYLKNIVMWIKKHQIVSGFLWAIIGGLVSWVLAWILISPPVEVSNLPQKELTCTLN